LASIGDKAEVVVVVVAFLLRVDVSKMPDTVLFLDAGTVVLNRASRGSSSGFVSLEGTCEA